MKVLVLELDVPNKNNRLYTTEVMAQALKKDEYLIYRELPLSGEVPAVSDAVGSGKPILEHGALYLDCKFSTPELEQDVRDGKLSVRTFGVGSIINNKVMDDYKIECFFLTDKPA